VSLLECRGVTRIFRGARRVVDEVTLSAEPGDIVGIIGPNGAGKTTLLRIIAGDLATTSGSVVIAGHRCGSRVARALVGYAAEPPLAPPELTGLEWLRYLAAHGARGAAERLELVRAAIEIGELETFVGRRIAEYSRGMAQRLAVASASLAGRRVILLDETLGGIDPLVARLLRRNLARIAAADRVVLLASHDLSAVEQVATRAVILLRGRIAGDVSMATLLGERVLELSLNGGGLANHRWLLQRFRGSLRTGGGVAIPLVDGLSVEQVLEECREQRVAVAGSRVRYRRLEDILVAQAARQ
jgi:ABC-type multidrug transport system ATPase subunit